jgi:tetratricopeptide (TPR) repeat protein
VCFEQALAALAHLPESPDTLTRAVDLRFDLRNSLFALGDSRRILEHLRTAEAVAEALGDRSRLGRVHSYLTNYFLATRDHDRAIESGERALALAAAVGDSGLELSTNFYLSQLYADIGEYRRARDCTRRTVTGFTGVSAPKGLGQPAVLLLSRLWLVWCLAELGEFPEGQARAEEAVREAEAFAQPFDWILAYLGLGLLHLRQGALDRAIRALEQGLPLCRSGELSIWFPGMASPLGYAYALSGRLSAALPLLEQAVAETTLRRGAGHALRTTHLGEAYLLAGREEEAARMAAQALELSRGHRERGHQAYALRLLAELAACPDPPVLEPAQTRYQEAIAVADELGMRPLAARCRLGLGALYARLRRPEPARAELAAAVALFEAMGMSAELSRATGLRAIVD